MAKKKDLKEEVIVDVQQVYNKSEEFVERNKKILTSILVGIVLVFAGFAAYKYFVVMPKESKAVTELYKSQMYLMQDSLNLVLEGDDFASGSEDIASQYSGTSAGSQAAYITAIAYRDQSDYDTAIEYFKKCDFDDAIIGVLAKGNIGDMYIEKGEYAEGAKYLEDAGRKAMSTLSEEFSAPLYLYKASIAYMEVENYSKAKELLSIVADDYAQWKDHAKAVKILGSLNNK